MKKNKKNPARYEIFRQNPFNLDLVTLDVQEHVVVSKGLITHPLFAMYKPNPIS